MRELFSSKAGSAHSECALFGLAASYSVRLVLRLRSEPEINKLTLLIGRSRVALRWYYLLKGAIWGHAASVCEIRAVYVFIICFARGWARIRSGDSVIFDVNRVRLTLTLESLP